jgi:hypothetical protein
MNKIKILFFRESIRQYTLLPEQPPQVKKAIICAFWSYVSKWDFLSLKALKHPTPGQASETMSQRTTAIFVGFCFVIIIRCILCSSVLQQACGSSLPWDFNNKHSEESTSRIQRLWEPLENFQFTHFCWFPSIDENRFSKFAH